MLAASASCAAPLPAGHRAAATRGAGGHGRPEQLDECRRPRHPDPRPPRLRLAAFEDDFERAAADGRQHGREDAYALTSCPGPEILPQMPSTIMLVGCEGYDWKTETPARRCHRTQLRQALGTGTLGGGDGQPGNRGCPSGRRCASMPVTVAFRWTRPGWTRPPGPSHRDYEARNGRAGTPPYVCPLTHLPATTAPAAITQSLSTTVPGRITARAPIHTRS